jgi:hypothetical protein
MQRRFFYDPNILEWKTISVFAFLGDHHRPHSSERGNLPVDVQHLRF